MLFKDYFLHDFAQLSSIVVKLLFSLAIPKSQKCRMNSFDQSNLFTPNMVVITSKACSAFVNNLETSDILNIVQIFG